MGQGGARGTYVLGTGVQDMFASREVSMQEVWAEERVLVSLSCRSAGSLLDQS